MLEKSSKLHTSQSVWTLYMISNT